MTGCVCWLRFSSVQHRHRALAPCSSFVSLYASPFELVYTACSFESNTLSFTLSLAPQELTSRCLRLQAVMQVDTVVLGPIIQTSTSADPTRPVHVVSTSPGRPVARLAAPPPPRQQYLRPPPPSRRFVAPLLEQSDPLLLSSAGHAQDLEFDEEVSRLQLEVEKDKERQRIVAGVDTEDLNALLRAFDKVCCLRSNSAPAR